jgi:hypothetical protein
VHQGLSTKLFNSGLEVNFCSPTIWDLFFKDERFNMRINLFKIAFKFSFLNYWTNYHYDSRLFSAIHFHLLFITPINLIKESNYSPWIGKVLTLNLWLISFRLWAEPNTCPPL